MNPLTLLVLAAAAGSARPPHSQKVIILVLPDADQTDAEGPEGEGTGDGGDAAERLLRGVAADGALIQRLLGRARARELPHGTAVDRTGGVQGMQRVQCLRPVHSSTEMRADAELLAEELTEGRRCLSGRCLPHRGCGLLLADGAASAGECEQLKLHHARVLRSGRNAYSSDSVGIKTSAMTQGEVPEGQRSHLTLLRVVERMRRLMCATFNESVSACPLTFGQPRSDTGAAYVVGREAGLPGGAPIKWHADECSIPTYHYSFVLYLDTQGEGFEAGEFQLRSARAGAPPPQEPPPRLRVAPRCGRALVFSSGWENTHRVTAVTRGRRHSLNGFLSSPAAASPAPEPRGRRLRRLRELCISPRTALHAQVCLQSWVGLFRDS